MLRTLVFGAVFSLACVGNMAAVDRLRVIVENNPGVPGEAKIFCPHIGKWIQKDGAGIAPPPAPFANVEIIEVEPLNTALYGPKFKNFFPVHDGVISLRAIPVTTALLVKVEHYKAAEDLDKGAMASALVATRSGFVAKETSLKYQRIAFELLGKKYRVPISYVADGGSLHGSPQLADAV